MKTPARNFKELTVWQKARQFALELHRFTRLFPADEKFGPISPMRRAAISVPANIAEGFPKRSGSDRTRFFNIAQGSLEGVHYCLILANDLEYGDPARLLELYDEVGRLLNGYISAFPTPRS
jgi:four helix bundle protein